jgi:hypothetical protein
VAEIPPKTIAKILELIGRLSTLIDRSSAAELAIFNTYGETEEVSDVLEPLDNTKERGIVFQLEELTAYVDAEIRKSPLTAYRLGKTPQPTIDRD